MLKMMNKCSCVAALLIAVSGSAWAQSQPNANSRSSSSDEIAVTLHFKETPNFKFSNEANVEKNGPSKWLVIEIDFVPTEKKLSKDKYAWIDDLLVQFDLLMPSTYNGKPVMALLSGTAVYWGVPLDGKKHSIDGYMPPQVLHRYLREGIKIKKSLLDELDARISFYTKDKRLLVRYYNTRKGEDSAAVARRFARAEDTVAGGVIQVKDGIYPRNKTPWQFINFGATDLIKPDSNNR